MVGGWWNRTFDPEIDLIGGDRAPVAKRLFFAGSVKWLGTHFDNHDLAALLRAAAQVPGFTAGKAGLVGVSLSGVRLNDDQTLDLVWGPRDVIDAWPS